jgi:2-polyprenyl-3-methyl-5-hydroxy-6-metoxy-1,4-benzoquinol methylase
VKTWSTPVRAGSSNVIPCSLCGGLDFKPALNCENFAFVRCKSCGLVQMNPQPVKNEIIERYSSAFGKDYLSYEIQNEDSFLKLQQLALKDAGFDAYGKDLFSRAGAAQPSVLDVGCATGALIASLRDKGWRVTGVEISPSAEYARKEKNLDVRDIPLEDVKFEDESFDTVLASHLIEHLNDPRSFLKETHRILKKEGRVFISTPNISGMQARLCRGKWRSAIFDHLYLFSIRTLSELLRSTGFRTEKTATWGGLAAGLAPKWIKKPADILAKRLGFGDVMIIRARKI